MSWRAAEGVACLAFGRLSACSYVLTCLLVGALQAQTPSPAGAAPVPTQEAEAEPLRHKSRYFLWTELNLVGVYSSLSGEFDSTPRPQRTSVGFEFAGVLRDGRRLKRPAGGGVDGVRFDLHPLAIYDPIEDAFEIVFHDAWLQLDLGGRRATNLRFGQFLLPFGQNPVLEPRGFFLLPLTAIDLGFKRDWGLSLQTHLGKKVLEVGVTAGSGLGFHPDSDSYLLSARIGTPTNRDLQIGVSALHGKVREIMAEEVMSELPVRRWRASGDLIYMANTSTLFKGEIAYGRDESSPVGGYKLEVDYVVPRLQRLELKGQLMSWFNDLDSGRSDDTALTLGLAHSLATSVTLSVFYVHDLERFMGAEDKRVAVQIFLFRRSRTVGH